MAAKCIAEIRRVQPRGPYSLAGASFGGRVCFEIAQQLVRDGEHVSFLGLIDTANRDLTVEGRPLLSEAIHLRRKVRESSGFRDLFARGLRYISQGPQRLRYELWYWRYDTRVRHGHSIPEKYRPAFNNRISVRATRRYVPKPYPGHITMFSSAGNSERQRAHWGPLALGGLSVLEVPAGHNDMVFPPHNKILAEQMDACLDAEVR